MQPEIRRMTREEETELAEVVLLRDVAGMERAEYVAATLRMAPDLLDLMRQGVVFESVPGLGAAGGPGSEWRWSLPGRTH